MQFRLSQWPTVKDARVGDGEGGRQPRRPARVEVVRRYTDVVRSKHERSDDDDEG